MPDRFKELQPYVPPPAGVQEDTRTQACRQATRSSRRRMAQILQLLADQDAKPEDRGLCIFEVAAALSIIEQTTIHDHQISGRFRAMVEGGLIERSGATRPTPTGCQAAIYQITLAGKAVHQEHLNALRTGGEHG